MCTEPCHVEQAADQSRGCPGAEGRQALSDSAAHLAVLWAPALGFPERAGSGSWTAEV